MIDCKVRGNFGGRFTYHFKMSNNKLTQTTILIVVTIVQAVFRQMAYLMDDDVVYARCGGFD